ncbi:GAF and ANTAR domain-containing protein [Actinoplanes regularis]|uniref:GAF and ANTAR domain-containing protein n=1 Tax=Actinoplanes regularis TaxID=52697 RepID=UPI001A4A626D|nr:GAF and ANTAR domain-containing protein [Actinoplanes regularis]GIE90915.1 GAF domain-containing protein [Actinoplanes regularis]
MKRLRRICSDATEALSAAGVGVSVMADGGVRGVAAASDPIIERIEELQFTLGEGPCVDAYATSRPIFIPDLDEHAMRRWPAYAPAVHQQGIRAVFAFPLQVGAVRLGVLDVFRTDAGQLSRDQLGQAVMFADRAVTILLDGQDQLSNDQELDEAVEHRARLYQAQGMVMVQMGISLAEAMVRLRAYAYAEDRPLSEVAADIVARRLRFDSPQL